MDAAIAAEFAALGVTVTMEAEEGDSDAFGVWDINWPSLKAFLACQTQWRVAVGFGGMAWLGLDYAAVDVVLRRTKADDRVFEDLQLMEMAALKTFDEVEA